MQSVPQFRDNSNLSSQPTAVLTAREVLRALITEGKPPNGVAPESCGEFAEYVAALYDAHDEGGTEGARRAFDTLAKHNPALAELVAGEPEPQRRLLTYSELLTLPPARWLPGAEREIPAGAFAVLFGASASGKSFVVLDRYAIPVSQHTPVVYVAAEGAAGYARRLKAWMKHHRAEPGQLHFWPEPVLMMDPAAVKGFIGEIASLRPGLVVIDTLARCMVGGDENSAKDMGAFIAACDEIRQTTGATVLVVHHTGRNGDHERGSTALFGAADVMLKVENEDGLISLVGKKTKDGAPFDRVYLRLVPVDLGEVDELGDPITSCVILPAKKVMTFEGDYLTDAQREVLEFLNHSIFEETGARTKEIQEGTSVPYGTLYKVLSNLKNRGYLTQASKGQPYYITNRGRELVRGDSDA